MAKLTFSGKHATLDILNEVKRVQDSESSIHEKIDSVINKHDELTGKHSDLGSYLESIKNDHNLSLSNLHEKTLDLKNQIDSHSSEFANTISNLSSEIDKRSILVDDKFNESKLLNDRKNDECHHKINVIELKHDLSLKTHIEQNNLLQDKLISEQQLLNIRVYDNYSQLNKKCNDSYISLDNQLNNLAKSFDAHVLSNSKELLDMKVFALNTYSKHEIFDLNSTKMFAKYLKYFKIIGVFSFLQTLVISFLLYKLTH